MAARLARLLVLALDGWMRPNSRATQKAKSLVEENQLVLALLLGNSGAAARFPIERANFTGLVLGCIEAKVCKKICV